MNDGTDSSKTTWYLQLPSEDGLQFFREEKYPDAIYDVYFKKVQYATRIRTLPRSEKASNHIIDSETSDTEGLQWRLQEIHIIKAGTLEKIIECITNSEGEMNGPHVNVLLDTYRSFAEPLKLMEHIFFRYKQVSADDSKKEVVRENILKSLRLFLNAWLNLHPHDFSVPPFHLLQRLNEFCKETLGNHADLTSRVQGRLERCMNAELEETTNYFDDIDSLNTFSGELENDTKYNNGFHKKTNKYNHNSNTINNRRLIPPVSFDDIPSDIFAQQITYEDSRLFKSVIRHQCLPYCWSKRTKSADNPSFTVSATIEHFNEVAKAVYSTVLNDPRCNSKHRAKRIEKWIEIACELRMLKNYSSTLAVVSGLKIESVYRLKSVWKHVNKESKQIFEELDSMFSSDSREISFKDLMQREGTAKGVDSRSIGVSQRMKDNSKRRLQMKDDTYGSVPFFGSYLTDIIHLSETMEDYVEGGLINFDKKRKEAELLAQIRLMQVSASNYSFQKDPVFHEWFYKQIRRYSDDESFQISKAIEPIRCNRAKSLGRSLSNNFKRDELLPIQKNFSGSETSSLSNYSDPFIRNGSVTLSTIPRKRSTANELTKSVSLSNLLKESCETYIAKVLLDSRICDKTTNYKSIPIYNDDRIKMVLIRIFEKFGRNDLKENVDRHCLSQVLDNGTEYDFFDSDEVKTNVFYALNAKQKEIKLIVRLKSDMKILKDNGVAVRFRKKNRQKYFSTFFQ